MSIKFNYKTKKIAIPAGINPNISIDKEDIYNTSDADIVASDVIEGKIGYGKDGKIVGTLDLDNEKEISYQEGIEIGKTEGINEGREEIITEQSDANITSYDVLEGKIGYSKNNERIVGSLKNKSKVSMEELEYLCRNWRSIANDNGTPINIGSYATISLCKFSDKLFFEGTEFNGVNSFTYNPETSEWKYVYDAYGNEFKQPSNNYYDSFANNYNKEVDVYNYYDLVGTLYRRGMGENNWYYNSLLFDDITYETQYMMHYVVNSGVKLYNNYHNYVYPRNLVTNEEYSGQICMQLESNGQGFQLDNTINSGIFEDFIFIEKPYRFDRKIYNGFLTVTDNLRILDFDNSTEDIILNVNYDDMFAINAPNYFNISLNYGNWTNYYPDTFKNNNLVKGYNFNSITGTPKFGNMFTKLFNLEYVKIKNVATNNFSNNTMYYMFDGCSNLSEVELLFDCSKVNDIRYMFYNCFKLTSIKGLFNLGQSLSTSVNYRTLDLHNSPINRESILDIFNNIYDLASDNKPTAYIKLSAVTQSLLSADDIAIATAKGWTVQA